MIDFGYGNKPTHEQTPLRKIVLEKRQKNNENKIRYCFFEPTDLSFVGGLYF